MDVVHLICLYEGTDTGDWAAFLEGVNDVSCNDMADATEGFAGFCSKLSAADETWAASGLSCLVLVTMLGSDERGGAVPKNSLVPHWIRGQEHMGRQCR